MSELTQPGFMDWVGAAIRELRPADRYVKIEIPRNVYLDPEMFKAVFVNDEDAVIQIKQGGFCGQTETLCGKIKDPALFDTLVKLWRQVMEGDPY
jgi:hypothetical protein